MARKKVKLIWIVNDATRKTSLKKRRVGLLKKVSELTILCGVEALIIVYSPDEPEPVVWPSRLEVEQLISRFRNMPDMDRYKKMTNQETYLKERIGKMHDQSNRHARRNMEMEMASLLHQVYSDKGFDRLDQTQLCGLVWMVMEKLKDIKTRIEYFQQIPPFQPAGSIPPGFFTPQEPVNGDRSDGIRSKAEEPGAERINPIDGAVSWEQWFNDIINNPEHNIAGGSSTKNDLGLSHPFSFAVDNSYREPDTGFHHVAGEEPNMGFHHENTNHGDSHASDTLGSGFPHSKKMRNNPADEVDFNLGFFPWEDSITDRIDLVTQLPHSSNAPGENNTGNDFEPWLPSGFNPGEEASNIGHIFQQGLPFVNNMSANIVSANQYDPWLARGDTRGDQGLGTGSLPNNSVSRNITGVDPFQELGIHHGISGTGVSDAGGSDADVFGILGGSSDLGFPFDTIKDWSHDKFDP